MALQDGQRQIVVVGIAVIKGDGSGAGRQITIAQSAHRMIQRQHIEPVLDPMADGIETTGVDFIGEQRIRLRQYSVEDKHR